MQTETYTLPAYWASALVNNDYSGMSAEDNQYLKNFIRINGGHHAKNGRKFCCVSCSNSSFFRWANNANHVSGDVLEYTFDVSPL